MTIHQQHLHPLHQDLPKLLAVTSMMDGTMQMVQLMIANGMAMAATVKYMAMDLQTLVLQLTNAVAAAEEET